jgi:O-antigen ligase
MILNRFFDLLPGESLPVEQIKPGLGEKIIIIGSIVFAIGIPWGHIYGYIGAAIIFFGAFLSRKYFHFDKNQKVLIVLFIIFFAWGLILSFTVALRPYNGFQTVFAYFSHWLAPFAIGVLLPARHKTIILYLWISSLFILGLMSLMAFAGLFHAPQFSKEGMLFGLHNHIQFAALLLLGFNILFGLFLTPNIRRKKIIVTGILAGLFLIFFILAGSRGWWVAAVVSSAGMTLHHILANRNRKMALLLAGAGILAAASIIAIFPQVRQRIENTNFNDPNYIHRRNMAVMASEVIKDHTVFGIGPGQTPFIKEYYDRMEEMNLPQETGYLKKRHFHNIYLQVAAEFGVPGLIIFLAIMFWSFKVPVSAAKDVQPGYKTGIIYGVTWSFAALAVAEMFDCLLRGPAVAMEYFWVLGLCAAMENEKSEKIKSRQTFKEKR